MRPVVGGPVHMLRHHPVGRPCTLALRQQDTGLEIAVLPAFAIVLGIHPARIDAAIVLKAVDIQLAIREVCGVLATQILSTRSVSLQLIVHIAWFPVFPLPFVSTELGAFIEFVVPHQSVSCDGSLDVGGRIAHALLSHLDADAL